MCRKAAGWLTLMLRTEKVLGLSLHVKCISLTDIMVFVQSRSRKCRITAGIRPRPFFPKMLSTLLLLIFLKFSDKLIWDAGIVVQWAPVKKYVRLRFLNDKLPPGWRNINNLYLLNRLYRDIQKPWNIFKNSLQIDHATDHGNSYVDRERNC